MSRIGRYYGSLIHYVSFIVSSDDILPMEKGIASPLLINNHLQNGVTVGLTVISIDICKLPCIEFNVANVCS